MKYLRYFAEFYDRHDRKYRVEISQEADTQYTPVEVELAANPLTIEWNEVSKLDPVRGSGATLRLISMSDRQFYDMYSVDYGVIELNVYREEIDSSTGAKSMKIYWSGTLDPELFSEPYAYLDRYVTEFTFVDFAVLDYAKWDKKGRWQLNTIIRECLFATRIQNANFGINYDLISTSWADENGYDVSISLCGISADNFYDEDGEAFTYREVLEEVLRPFALQITQRDGRIYLYDTQSLSTLDTERIEWYSDDSTLEVDKVYNNVRVNFSPADAQEIADTEIDPEDILQSGGLSKIMAGTVKGETEPIGWFTLHWGVGGENNHKNITVKNGATLFRIQPEYSGNEEAGVLWGASFPDFAGNAGWFPNAPACALQYTSTLDPSYALWPTIPCKPILKLEEFTVRGKQYLETSQILVSLDLLYDFRSNPFEDADLFASPNDKAAADKLVELGVYCYIPVIITARSISDGKLYRYTNNYRRMPGYSANDQFVGWVEVSDESDVYYKPAWLCYYNDDFNGKGVLNGWQTNKRIVGKPINGAPILTEIQKRRNSGEYIDLPPVASNITIEVCSGVLFHNDQYNAIYRPDVNSEYASLTILYNTLYNPVHGWFAYKNLRVRYVLSSGSSDDYEEVDFEETGYINKLAREELKIDTVIGSAGKTLMAKGDISTLNGNRLTQFTRGGHTNTLERLLIGTAYSQYATRKNVLSGTIESPETFGLLSDATIDGKYMVVSEVQNVEEATSEIRAIELSPDNYEAIEEVVE